MLVVIANNLPPAVRGRMKLWFVEPKANVFVSGINDATAQDVVEYLFAHTPPSSGLVIFRKINTSPGYEIRSLGDIAHRLITLSGLQLILESEPDSIDIPRS